MAALHRRSPSIQVAAPYAQPAAMPAMKIQGCRAKIRRCQLGVDGFQPWKQIPIEYTYIYVRISTGMRLEYVWKSIYSLCIYDRTWTSGHIRYRVQCTWMRVLWEITRCLSLYPSISLSNSLQAPKSSHVKPGDERWRFESNRVPTHDRLGKNLMSARRQMALGQVTRLGNEVNHFRVITIYLPIYLSTYLPIYLSNLPVSLYLSTSVYLSIYLI